MKFILKTELYKLIKQSKTWYALGAVLVIEFIILGAAYYQGTAILELLLENLTESFYFEGNLLNGNLLLYVVLNSLWFNIPLILMIITSGIITEEYKSGTLQSLLLQSVQKRKLLIAKYMASLIFTVTVIVILGFTSFTLAYGIFGKGDLIVYLGTLNFFEEADAFRRISCAFLSGMLSMIFYTTTSITLGILLKDPAKTWIASAFFLIFCSLLLKLDIGLSNFDYLFFPKLTNSWQLFFEFNLDWKLILLQNIGLIIYSILFAIIGITIFNKQDIG
ncbi:ABC-2 type transport system permease protein [Pustulibacterium marinum]|uniref:ABC-2 type transport system permease protein n=1 Tax=Pustulibacterium marinum TaxID=1224947 RepID=A0A1I7GQY2_9FLAO|nr:ABC transporter permease [Pustulibacterium marinum]SFU50666.1 ABC-2 type transport system permease protein [Pustulibacterium marinum]